MFFGLQCTMIRTLKRSRFFPISMRSLGIRIDVIGFFIQSGGLYKGHPALLLPSSKRPRRPCIVHNCCIYILLNINSNILSLFSGVTPDNCTHIQAGPKDGQKVFSCHTFFFLLGNPHQLHLSHALWCLPPRHPGKQCYNVTMLLNQWSTQVYLYLYPRLPHRYTFKVPRITQVLL